LFISVELFVANLQLIFSPDLNQTKKLQKTAIYLKKIIKLRKSQKHQ